MNLGGFNVNWLEMPPVRYVTNVCVSHVEPSAYTSRELVENVPSAADQEVPLLLWNCHHNSPFTIQLNTTFYTPSLL
jgi:hypothetical protein